MFRRRPIVWQHISYWAHSWRLHSSEKRMSLSLRRTGQRSGNKGWESGWPKHKSSARSVATGIITSKNRA